MIKKVYCQNTHDFVSLGSIKSFYAAVFVYHQFKDCVH